MTTQKKVIIIGGGIGGLGTACLLAKKGYQVRLYEKNEKLGGRMNVFSEQGYTFDMGPSWYLMPDVFEDFFNLIGKNVHDYLSLAKLGPSYRIFFKDKGIKVDLFSDLEKDSATFEQLEPGSSEKLRSYLKTAEYQYGVSKELFIYRNYDSVFDFFNKRMLTEGSKLSVFKSMDSYVKKYFSTDEIQKIMQYTLVFLGSSPYNTPAIYNIMSHIDFNMGVFYPMGGIYKIVDALVSAGREFGAEFFVQKPVKRILTENGKAIGVEFEDGEKELADIVISNADIQYTETKLLSKEEQSYSEGYWDKRVLAPSAFMMYLGVNGRIPSLTHHNLLFSRDWKKNFAELFDLKCWPEDPSIYVCAPSVTDPTVAPEGKENVCVLVPIAPGLTYTQQDLEQYGDKILATMEKEMGIPDLRSRIEFKRFFCTNDFSSLYNSYKGTALGLAHTLFQTAWFRPDTKSKKVENLFYVGANTNPGIGMPICLISAELVYKRIVGDHTIPHLKQL